MSISVLNRGASGGLKPELTVTAPAGSTIDLLQNGIIVDTYTLGTSETEHAFAVKVGTYSVRGTLGASTRTINVVIDSVGCYEVEIKYFIEVVTDFAQKEANWTEYGGTMRYGNGVYVNKGDTKGTTHYKDGVTSKYVEIPCYVETFDFSFIGYSHATGGNTMYGFYVELLDQDDISRCGLIVEDWWGVSNGQVWRVVSYNNGTFDYCYGAETYNGVDVALRFVYNGSKIDYYLNNSIKTSYPLELPNAITKVRIGFSASMQASEPIPESRVKNMKLLAL